MDNMDNNDSHSQRYLYKTKGVCPPEIGFEINDGILTGVAFRGGGCPGNAALVGRLLEGRAVSEVQGILRGIACRNDTSCPEQLADAVDQALAGALLPVASFKVHSDETLHSKIAVAGELAGDHQALARVIEAAGKAGAEKVYCLGNVFAAKADPGAMLELMQEPNLVLLAGAGDWEFAQKPPEEDNLVAAALQAKLMDLDQVVSFILGDLAGVGFYGDYLQNLEGFSDFDPYALEMNMVCNLADLMRDKSVFGAVEAMVPGFRARLILFAQRGDWGAYQVGDATVISVGAAVDGDQVSWGLLSWGAGGLDLAIQS